MRSKKATRRIVVGNDEYRWRATGNDGWISIGIWPINNGPSLYGSFCYHESVCGDWTSSSGRQIILTNRIIRRIIDYATTRGDNKSDLQGQQNLGALDDVIEWKDAVRRS